MPCLPCLCRLFVLAGRKRVLKWKLSCANTATRTRCKFKQSPFFSYSAGFFSSPYLPSFISNSHETIDNFRNAIDGMVNPRILSIKIREEKEGYRSHLLKGVEEPGSPFCRYFKDCFVFRALFRHKRSRIVMWYPPFLLVPTEQNPHEVEKHVLGRFMSG